jgi:hypothetical protein
MRQLYAYLLVGTISLGIQTALAEEPFTAKVVSSNAPQYQTNQTLKANDKITLADKQEIVLKHGKNKRRIKGPFSDLLKTVKKLFGVERSEVIDVWHLNVLKGEIFCYFPSKPVMLGRSTQDAQQAITLYLQKEGSQTRHRLNWPAFEIEIKWPEGLPIADGEQYTVKVRNKDSINYIYFYQLPDQMLDSSETLQAVEMEKKGCKRQADLLTYVD